MKKILIAVFLVNLSLLALGQTEVNQKLDEYIKNHGYVNLRDTKNLPYTVKYCQHLIEQYLAARAEKAVDYYVMINYTKLTNETISVPLIHINGLKKRQEKENEEVLIVGNASGKDGTIVINYNEIKVVRFYLSQ